MSTPIGNNGTNTTNTPNDTMGPNSAGTSAADLQQTFLKLLVTQLQNQDPTSPMDSSQMTSQLAQIDTVSGISQLNSTLGSLSAQLSASEAGQASSLIGRTVLVPGNGFTVATTTNSDGSTGPEASSPFGIKLPAAASDLTLQVQDSTGKVVRTIDLGAQPAGVIPVPGFNPVDDSGTALPVGNYTFSVQDAGGTATGSNAPVALTGIPVVSVITQADGTPGLTLLNGTTIPLNGGPSGIL